MCRDSERLLTLSFFYEKIGSNFQPQ